MKCSLSLRKPWVGVVGLLLVFSAVQGKDGSAAQKASSASKSRAARAPSMAVPRVTPSQLKKMDREHRIQLLRAYMLFLHEMEEKGLPATVASNAAEDPFDFLRGTVGARDASAITALGALFGKAIQKAASGDQNRAPTQSGAQPPAEEAPTQGAPVQGTPAEGAPAQGAPVQGDGPASPGQPAAAAPTAPASNGVACFYAGWESRVSGGLCSNPGRGGNEAYKKAAEACNGQGMACNPALFGPGLCVPGGNNAFKSCTQKFNSMDPPRTLEDVAKMLGENEELAAQFQSLQAAIQGVCAPGGFQATKPMCSALASRVSAIVKAAESGGPAPAASAPAEGEAPTPATLASDAKSEIDLLTAVPCFTSLESSQPTELPEYPYSPYTAIIPGRHAGKEGVLVFYAGEDKRSTVGFAPGLKPDRTGIYQQLMVHPQIVTSTEQRQKNIDFLNTTLNNSANNPMSRAYLDQTLVSYLTQLNDNIKSEISKAAPPAQTAPLPPESVQQLQQNGPLTPSQPTGENRGLASGSPAVTGSHGAPATPVEGAGTLAAPAPTSSDQGAGPVSEDDQMKILGAHAMFTSIAETCEKVKDSNGGKIPELSKALRENITAFARAKGVSVPARGGAAPAPQQPSAPAAGAAGAAGAAR